MHFKDRQHAAEQLAVSLRKYAGKDTVVYALPRGGAVLGAYLAKKLGLPFDLILTRKIGHPYNPEYAIAAVAENGEIEKNEEELRHIDQQWFKQEVSRELAEIKRRRNLYLGDRKSVDPKGKTAIVVDDGLATGLTMKAAIMDLRAQKAKTVIAAVPVAPSDTAREIARLVDEIVILHIPAGFAAIGLYYQDFPQVTDEEVVELVKSAII